MTSQVVLMEVALTVTPELHVNCRMDALKTSPIQNQSEFLYPCEVRRRDSSSSFS